MVMAPSAALPDRPGAKAAHDRPGATILPDRPGAKTAHDRPGATIASRGDRWHAGIERLSRAPQDAAALVRALAGQLQAAVPGDAVLLLRTDPTTVLPTDGVVEALPPGLCKPFWDNELLEEDFNKFVTLARGDQPAATLRAATGGDLSRSRRYTTMYRTLGVSDELRVSFTTRDGSCWGIAQLVRTAGATFSPRERDLLAATAPAVAGLLRAGVTSPPARSLPGGPALVILDRDGEIDSITPEARDWLADLTNGTGMAPVPEPVYAVAARARAAGGDGGGAPRVPRAPASAQVRAGNGGWLHLHATCLESTGSRRDLVAVVITPAQPPDLVPLLALGYRLTQREQQVLQYLARGMTTADITARLGISAHTVRDHIKALFGKVGVRSRAELVARIFAEHYFDRLEVNLDRAH